MQVALISLNQQWLDKTKNFSRCKEMAHEAARRGCALAIYPEMTLTGYSLDIKRVSEPAKDAHTLRQLGALAQETGIELVFGACLLDQSTGQPRNTLCLASGDGTSRLVYTKMHPFSFAGEDKVLEAGKTLGYVDMPGMRLGSSICYDLRFPELYAAMALHCHAAICIANWPAARVAHWRALLVARAIENQMYMIGVNRIGQDGNGLLYEKSSLIIGPDGTTIDPVYSSLELDIYDIDADETTRYRGSFPTVRDKRYALYQELFGAHTC